MKNNSRRLFALEEAYVTIFPEYSPFFCFPVLPGSRTLGPNGWQLAYDLSGNPNLKVGGFIDPSNTNISVPFYYKWQDIYMTDLRWNKDPAKVNWIPSGLPYQFTETVGYDCKLNFNAAHFSDALWRLAGFRKYYRIFVDVKASSIAQVERSWEFRGCSVDTSSYGGSPISITRGFNVKEIPPEDAIGTLNVAWRARNIWTRQDSVAVQTTPAGGGQPAIFTGRNTAIEIIDISDSPVGDMIPGVYNLEIDLVGINNTFNYNGIYLRDDTNHIIAQPWRPNTVLTIDGGIAGVITFMLVSSLTPTASVIEPIAVNT